MIHSLFTSHIHCWWRTGSRSLLSKTGNAPIRSALLKKKQTHLANVSCQISKLDAQNYRGNETTSGERTSNPHSLVETKQEHPLQPRGFLP